MAYLKTFGIFMPCSYLMSALATGFLLDIISSFSKARFRSACLFCVLCHSILCAAQTSSANLQDLFAHAQLAQKQGDYAAAAHDYSEILQLSPQQPEARANLGLMQHLLGKPTDAIESFRLALVEKPNLFPANLFLGIDLMQTGHPRDALAYLRRAAQLKPQDFEVNLSLARAYSQVHELSEANDFYQRAAEIDPGNVDATYGLGTTYLSLQQSAAQKLSEQPDSFYARLTLAESFADEGRTQDSIRIFRTLVGSRPLFPGLHAALGFNWVEIDDLPQAQAEFKTELAAYPGYLLAKLGIVRVELEEKEKSPHTWDSLQDIWKIDPGFTQANIQLLWWSRDAGKTAALKARIQQLAKSQPQSGVSALLFQNADDSKGSANADKGIKAPPKELLSPEAGITSAAALYSTGHYTDCARKLEALASGLGTKGLSLLAECSYDAGNYRQAFRLTGLWQAGYPSSIEAAYWRAKSAAKLTLAVFATLGLTHPNSYEVCLLLGQAYLDMNRFDEAETEYNRVLETRPGELTAQLGLGAAYWKDRKFGQAEPYLKAVLQVRPNDAQASYMLGEMLVECRQYSDAYPYLVTAANGTGRDAIYAHGLLGKVYASQGKTEQAIAELKLAASTDEHGSLHFQLYHLYQKAGDQQAARAALERSEVLRQQEQKRASNVLPQVNQ